MTALGFLLTAVSASFCWVAHISGEPWDKKPPQAYDWALGGIATGLALMVIGVSIWLWRVMP